jgi:hypothetical protein
MARTVEAIIADRDRVNERIGALVRELATAPEGTGKADRQRALAGLYGMRDRLAAELDGE